MSFKKKLIKNVLVLGSYTYGSQALNFLSTIVLSRLLTPAEYGFVALITVFTGFITIFSDAGLSFAIIRSDYGRTYHRALGNLSMWMGLLLFVITAILSYPIALFYGNYELIIPTIVLASLFIVRALTIVPSAILSKQLKFSFLGKRTLIVSVGNILLTILLAWLKFSYWALIIPQIFTATFNYFLIEKEVKLGFKIYPFAYTKVAYKKCISLMGNVTGFNFINYWARNADNLIVGKMYGPADLGIYNRAYGLLTLSLQLLTGLFGSILMPSLKELKSKGGDINEEYRNVLSLISILNFPVAVVLILFAHPFVKLLWGVKWIMVADFLPYFGLLIFSQTLMSTTGNIFILLGKERDNLVIGSINAVLLIVFIGVGAFFSVLDVVRFYTLGFLVVNLPINIYFGFVKSFGFSYKFVLTFWVPKLIISLLLFVSIWLNNMVASATLLTAMLGHICFDQRENFIKLLSFLQARRSTQ